MNYSIDHMHYNPKYELLNAGRQMQYDYIPRQIIVEELLDMQSMNEWHWWVIDGHPMFVCKRCGLEGSYYSSRFVQLNMSLGHYPACSVPPLKPQTWDTMLDIVSQLSAHVQGLMRLDLYADDNHVYFSEITFTTSSCDQELHPTQADALLYAILYKNLTHAEATPELVEHVINEGVLPLSLFQSTTAVAE
jgi:hypothetical protein